MKGKIAAWVLDNIPLPYWAAPYVFGLMIGRMPHKAPDPETKPPRRDVLAHCWPDKCNQGRDCPRRLT